MVGWLATGFEGYGLVIGGVVGAAFGRGLRMLIRAEVERATEGLLAKLEANQKPFSNEIIRRSWSDDVRRAPVQPEIPTPPSAPPVADTQEAPTAPVIRAEAAKEELIKEMAFASPFSGEKAPESANANSFGSDSSNVIQAAQKWLFGGNTIVRVGLVVLFVGLSFLASYAASAGLFPVEMRLALVGLFGAGLIAFGFRTQEKRPQFGLALQGGGVATIYLTLYGTTKLIDNASPVAAFVLMMLICALGCALALLQRSQALAATSFIGGFAVPLLLSTGGGDVAGLFAYYSLLNFAILFISVRRSWRVVNIIGFISTFGVLTLVVGSGAGSKQFMATQAFLIVSVLVYVATAILYTRLTPSPAADQLPKQGLSQFGNMVDTTLLFGTALIGFGLEVSLVEDRPFGSAFAALSFAALYLALAAFTTRYLPKANRLLSEALLAVGVIFVTLAVPLALGARWTSAVWALEGAGAFWIGMRQARWLPRLFGLVLQGLAAFFYIAGLNPNETAIPLANPAFMGAMLVALPILVTAYWLQKPLPHSGSALATTYAQTELNLAKPAFFVGFAYWWLAWGTEIHRKLPPVAAGQMPEFAFSSDLLLMLTMLAFLVSALGFQFLGRRVQWQVAIWPSAASLIALGIGLLGNFAESSHILYSPDWLLWVIAIGLHIWMLYVNDHDAVVSRPILAGTHIGGVWLGVLLLADCMDLALDSGRLWETSWAGVGFLVILVAVLIGLTWTATRRMHAQFPSLKWPLDRHSLAYGWQAAVPIAALVGLGALTTALLASGEADPLPYIPLMNPVDLSVALALAALVLWRHYVIAAKPGPVEAKWLAGREALAVLALLAFIAINTAWLRVTHQILGVAWSADALFASFYVQTGLAILWTVLALPLMVIAHRRTDRSMWLVGAGLLGLTVAKLMLVDLNNTGGGARIIAFIAVGVLMLIVGYLAPIPPRVRDPEAPSADEASRKDIAE